MSNTTNDSMRTKALVALAVAVLIGVFGWIWLSRVMDSGVERLDAIDRARADCERAWNAATNRAETLAVDRMALKDTIDPRSNAALRRCGDLHATPAQTNPTR